MRHITFIGIPSALRDEYREHIDRWLRAADAPYLTLALLPPMAAIAMMPSAEIETTMWNATLVAQRSVKHEDEGKRETIVVQPLNRADHRVISEWQRAHQQAQA
jgi:hypothetical protein